MEKNKAGKGDRCVCVRVHVSILKRVIREGLSEKVTFEQRPEGAREPIMRITRRRPR